MKIEAKYNVGIRDIGKNNLMTNVAFLGYMEELGSLHSEMVGYGINAIETKKIAWILMDWKLEIIKRPKYNDEITIKTWARKNSKPKFYTYRDFEVYAENEKVAIATSKWVLFDLVENKITKITDEIMDLYIPEEEFVFEEFEIDKLKEKENQEFMLNYEVKRQDIDVNKHMHNLNYLKLAYEALPEEIYNDEEKNNVRIMYKHQILLGDNVKCYYSNLDSKDTIEIKSEDDKTLHAIIELF